MFGPVLPDHAGEGLDEAIEKRMFHLWPGFVRLDANLDRATPAVERLEAGYTWINSPQIIFDELPFGGLKQSGLGKEHGEEALDYYMETKSVVVARGEKNT